MDDASEARCEGRGGRVVAVLDAVLWMCEQGPLRGARWQCMMK